MFDVSKLLEYNKDIPEVRAKVENKAFHYTLNSSKFGMTEIAKIVGVLLRIEKGDPFRLPLVIDLGTVSFFDKLSYVLLECLCYYSLSCKRRSVQVRYKPRPTIASDGILVSPLLLLSRGGREAEKRFLTKFELDIQMNHYRKLIKADDAEKNSYFASELVADISTFLKPFDTTERYRNELAEVMGELVDNAVEHAKSDCLVDIDISRDYYKRKTGEQFRGVSVVVINLSDILLGNRLRKKLKNDELLNDRDNLLKESMVYHETWWGDDYKEDDFYNIASFQDRISGRDEKTVTGGTGLTKLISSLERESDRYDCYVLSGERTLRFAHKFLEYNADGWIGFNEEKDFLNAPPNGSILGKNPVFIQGTAYNLSFAMQKEA